MLKTAFVAAVVAIATMQGASEFVELDVVALDHHDRVVTDPTGLTQSSRVTNGSLVRQTGGDVLRNSTDFGAAGARIWGESSHYYLLGYWTLPSAGHLRPIEVRTSRGNVQVRARRFR